MLPVHAGMHHEDAGFHIGALTGLKDHRTDGQIGWSAPLQYFDVGLVLKPQSAVPVVGDLDLERLVVPERHIAVVDLLLVDDDRGGSPSILRYAFNFTAAGLVSEEKPGDDQQDSPKNRE